MGIVAVPAEGTNFDFHARLEDGRQLFFEVKYTEDGFASARANDARKRKLSGWYKPHLEGKVSPAALEPAGLDHPGRRQLDLAVFKGPGE